MIYDVAVIGTGPSGVVGALEARRLGLDVCVIGPSVRHELGIAESLMPTAVRELEAFAIPVEGTSSAGIEASWGDAALTFESAIKSPHGPAIHVERGLFDASLGAALLKQRIVRVDSTLRSAHRDRDVWRLVGDGSTTAARFVLDASGRSAAFARRTGARRLLFDTMICTVATFEHALRAPPTSLLVEAEANGWWFCAPMGESATSATFITSPRAATPLNADVFTAAVARTTHIRRRLDGSRIAALRRRVAGSALLMPSTGAGWLAVGDAVAVIDPLSGAGVRDAIQTARLGARSCARALNGDIEAFPEYARSIMRSFRTYAATRAAQYALENRWPTQPFWARRRIDPFGRLSGKLLATSHRRI